jgi:tetratricopeptide (TPR) repeat protein
MCAHVYTELFLARRGDEAVLTSTDSGLEKAAHYYEKALQLDAEDPTTLYMYARFLGQRQQFAEAGTVDCRTGSAELIVMVTAKGAAGGDDDAERLYLRALEVDPNNISALMAYVDFLRQLHREAESAGFLNRVAQIKERHGAAYSTPVISPFSFTAKSFMFDPMAVAPAAPAATLPTPADASSSPTTN